MSFPYASHQIRDAVETAKNPRDWYLPEFTKTGEHSKQVDIQLERKDGLPHQLRLVIRAGVDTQPLTYAASLLLENVKVRGIDYHAIARSYKYREIIPKGWHEDIIDPNLDQSDKNYHRREALPDFAPFELQDFLNKVAAHWHIELPPTENLFS